MRSAIRCLPSVLVVTLLVLVARAQPVAPRAEQRAPASAFLVVPIQVATQCPPLTLCATTSCQSASLTSMMTLSPGVILAQPVHTACIVSGSALYVAATQPLNYLIRYSLFDPQAQDPFVSTMPLDAVQGVTTTANWVKRDFRRPIVLVCVEGVAQPTQPSGYETVVAATVSLTSTAGNIGRGSTDRVSTTPAYVVISTGAQPLSGPDPYLAHETCEAGFDEQQLRVLQQVLRSTTPVAVTATAEVVQAFVAPVTATAEWVELAIASKPSPLSPMQVSIFDPGALSVPPPGPSP